MEGTRNTIGFILNRQSHRERDTLVTLYTKDFGKLRLVARGTAKSGSKLAGHIEPLTQAEIMIIPGRGSDYIGSVLSIEVYHGIREDLNKLFFAGRALGALNRLVRENQPDTGLFFLLAGWLSLVDTFEPFDKKVGELFSAVFSLKLLGEMGYRPEMYRCLACGKEIKPGKNYFNLLGGGLVCPDCAVKRLEADGQKSLLTISDNCVKLVRFIFENDLAKTSKIKLDNRLVKEAYDLSEDFLKFCC